MIFAWAPTAGTAAGLRGSLSATENRGGDRDACPV